MRPYQKEGVGWLLFLMRAGLHGALCDEMGLGKTLQVSHVNKIFKLTCAGIPVFTVYHLLRTIIECNDPRHTHFSA